MEDEKLIKIDQNDYRFIFQLSYLLCKFILFGRLIGKLLELMAEEKGLSMLRLVGSNKCIKLYVGIYILVSFNENRQFFCNFFQRFVFIIND